MITKPALASNVVAVTCCADKGGSFFAVGLDKQGQLAWKTKLPGRGHGIAVHSSHHQAVVFARRPGTFLFILDKRLGRVIQNVSLPSMRHTFGHGAFSRDGALLYSVEHDYEAGVGVVGIYDGDKNFDRIGELPSYGVGPHEALLLPDGTTLAVANGGILTHPDYPRRKLNLASMVPSVAFIDVKSGRLKNLVSVSPDLHQMSMRHLAVDRSSRVWIGCQYEGPMQDAVSLLGVTSAAAKEVAWAWPPTGDWVDYRQYIGSVVAEPAGDILFSSPRGGVVGRVRSEDSHWYSASTVLDVCGLACTREGVLMTDGRGRVWLRDALLAEHPELAFDNHSVSAV